MKKKDLFEEKNVSAQQKAVFSSKQKSHNSAQQRKPHLYLYSKGGKNKHTSFLIYQMWRKNVFDLNKFKMHFPVKIVAILAGWVETWIVLLDLDEPLCTEYLNIFDKLHKFIHKYFYVEEKKKPS